MFFFYFVFCGVFPDRRAAAKDLSFCPPSGGIDRYFYYFLGWVEGGYPKIVGKEDPRA